jgi:hypothetical protein
MNPVRIALKVYLKKKLPPGWKVFNHENGYPGYDDIIVFYRHCEDRLTRMFTVVIKEDYEKTAQEALHIAWGWKEIGYV